MNILDSFKNEYLFWMNILDLKKMNICFEFWLQFWMNIELNQF